MKTILSIFLFCMPILFSAQIGNGKIKIRKTDQSIIGKTLSLYDLRTRECGTIFFEDEEICKVKFKYEKEDLKNIRVFLNSQANTKTIECDYELITDSSFIIKSEDYQDTCFYNFINENNNLVRFYNTPQGTFDKGSYAFFYGFDSVVYSQSYLRSLSDFKFTDSLSKLDSVYKNLVNEEERKKMNEEYKKQIEAYKQAINFSFFAGKHRMNGNQITLINKETYSPFATLFMKKKGDEFVLFSHNKFEDTYPLISTYTHKTYGDITFNYENCYIQYRKPITDKSKEIIKGDVFKTDTLVMNYPLGENKYAYQDADSFAIENTKYFEFAKIKGIVGGFYEASIESLNGNKLATNPLFFTAKKAISVSDINLKDTLQNWNYTIRNDIFFLYNKEDTLIDEMKNGLANFRFTYKNNEPYVFGAYHKKDTKSGDNEFILLFSNKTGVKYTTNKFDYKTARESIENDELIELPGVKYEYFKYNSTAEYLWIEYQNGNYEECKFFNYNKAIRTGKGRKINNYYLVN